MANKKIRHVVRQPDCCERFEIEVGAPGKLDLKAFTREGADGTE